MMGEIKQDSTMDELTLKIIKSTMYSLIVNDSRWVKNTPINPEECRCERLGHMCDHCAGIFLHNEVVNEANAALKLILGV